MNTEQYQRYLQSREWCEKREVIKERASNICERCKYYPLDHVHHLTYERIYNELLTDLQGICRDCHEYIHAKSDYDPASLPNAGESLYLTENRIDAFALRKIFQYVYYPNISTLNKLREYHVIICFSKAQSIFEIGNTLLAQGTHKVSNISYPTSFTSWEDMINYAGVNVSSTYIKTNQTSYCFYTLNIRRLMEPYLRKHEKETNETNVS